MDITMPNICDQIIKSPLQLPDNGVFVFGSNLAGRHGKGAAKVAHDEFGYPYKKGFGLHVTSRGSAYGIPTKGVNLRVLPLTVISQYINGLITIAHIHNELQFYVTPIGCGLAGYSPKHIAPLFKDRLDNMHLPTTFMNILNA